MVTRLKITGFTLSLVIFAYSSYAGSLCDSNCTLSIAFPTGGTIEAIEPLTITFGTGGLIDTVGSVTSYLDGEALTLNTSESLTFGSGGNLDIGIVGNIDYINMAVTTSGTITLSAVGGTEQILIPGGGQLSFSGGAQVHLNSIIKSEGTLYLGPNTSLIVFGSGVPSGCEILAASEATLTATGINSLTIDNNSSCESTSTLFSNSSYLTAGTVTVVDLLTSTTMGTITPINTGVINVVDPATLTDTDTNDDEGVGAFNLDFMALLLIIWTFSCIRNRFFTC